jgi:transposase
MSKGIINLTPAILRKIINEERQRIQEKKQSKKKNRLPGTPKSLKDAAKQTKEVGPTELAHTIAAEVDHYKALQAEAARLAKQLSEINEARQEIRAQILEKL